MESEDQQQGKMAEQEADDMEEDEEEEEFEAVDLDAVTNGVSSLAESSKQAARQNDGEQIQEHEDGEMEEVEFEEVDPESNAADGGKQEDDEGEEEEEEQEEEEDTTAYYADVHQDAGGKEKSTAESSSKKGKGKAKDPSKPRIYYDGKGQHAGLSISLEDGAMTKEQRKRKAQQDAEHEAKRRRRENMITPRDRQNRIVAHKLHLLALLAWCKRRNEHLQDEDLQAWLVDQVPKHLIQKQKQIHPKREPNQRERVRMFESFMNQLCTWWKGKWKLNPDMVAASAIRQPDADLVNGSFRRPGVRVDGWVYESAAERVEREKRERVRRDRWLKQVNARKKEWETARSAASAKSAGKGKRKESQPSTSKSAMEPLPPKPKTTLSISLFPPGSASMTKPPAYLRLAPVIEKASTPADLLELAMAMKGSRETSASLFASLCRALGIPARLVISPQVPPWSVAAAKIATSGGDAVGDAPSSAADSSSKMGRGTGGPPMHTRPDDIMTSDEEGMTSYASTSASAARRKSSVVTPVRSFFDTPTSSDTAGGSGSRRGSAASGANRAVGKTATLRAAQKAENASAGARKKRDTSVITLSDDDVASVGTTGSSVVESVQPGKGKAKSQLGKMKKGEVQTISDSDSDLSALSDGDSVAEVTPSAKKGQKPNGKTSKGKKGSDKKEAKSKDGDYRDDRWKNLDAPLKVQPKVKLRPHSAPRRASSGVDNDVSIENQGLLEPVNLQYPPTVWVEVFSKPFQRWLTVDPVRGYVFATGNRYMEPVVSDRQNKLVYVVAFEEDGYARDVTPRYTRTLNSRIAKMRPPPSKSHGDWWELVVKAFSRPFKLDRDAVEDAELEENSNREPMPTSMAGFKDHPVYAVEKHLKRDEVIFPATRVGTFQNQPVYLRSNVLTCRSARQWMNEGRSVKANQQPLKFVKSRAYTIGNKRAEEQAKAEGSELPQEGLYARFQTELYRPPPVVDGKIPTNAFGNIDLYVPTMLPEGAAHIPYNGSAKVAKKLGIPYAEAVVGFEFRKFRGMPKMGGIVVPIEHEQTVTEAFWASEHAQQEKEAKKKEQRALKNWRRLINAVKLAERIRTEYGSGTNKPEKRGSSQTGKKEVSRLRATEDVPRSEEADDVGAGGFLVGGEDTGPGGFLPAGSEPTSAPADAEEEPKQSRSVRLIGKYGLNGNARNGSPKLSHSRDDEDEGEEEEEEFDEVDFQHGESQSVSRSRSGKIVSLAAMAAAGGESEDGEDDSAEETEKIVHIESRTNGRRRRAKENPIERGESEPADETPNKRRRSARTQVQTRNGSAPSSRPSPEDSSRRRNSARRSSSNTTRAKLRATRAAEKELDRVIDELE